MIRGIYGIVNKKVFLWSEKAQIQEKSLLSVSLLPGSRAFGLTFELVSIVTIKRIIYRDDQHLVGETFTTTTRAGPSTCFLSRQISPSGRFPPSALVLHPLSCRSKPALSPPSFFCLFTYTKPALRFPRLSHSTLYSNSYICCPPSLPPSLLPSHHVFRYLCSSASPLPPEVGHRIPSL